MPGGGNLDGQIELDISQRFSGDLSKCGGAWGLGVDSCIVALLLDEGGTETGLWYV